MTAPPDYRRGRFVTGDGLFVDDVDVGRGAVAHMVRSSAACGELLDVDVSAALARPGVLAALTAADLPPVSKLPKRVAPFPGIDGLLSPLLASSEVRYVGQPVAVIVADDRYIAEDAAQDVSVVIECEGASTVASFRGAQAFERTSVRSFDSSTCDPGELVTLRREYRYARQVAAPLECRGIVASWADNQMTVWGYTKSVQFARDVLAEFLCIPVDRVTVVNVDVGGMFGVRGDIHPEELIIPWLARRLGRPIKWTEDRYEQFIGANQSRDQVHEISITATPEGRFIELVDHVTMDIGAYANTIGTKVADMTIESLPGPYQWEGWDLSCDARLSCKTPSGVMRGPGTTEATFARERLIDELADELGISPLQLRRKNLLRTVDMPVEVPLGPPVGNVRYDSGAYVDCLDDFDSYFGIPSWIADVETLRSAGVAAGIGFALFVGHAGYGGSESARLQLNDSGDLVVSTSACDFGQGLETAAVAVLRSVIPVDEGRVSIISGRSDAPAGQGTWSSRSTIFLGSSIHAAAVEFRQLALRAASEMSATNISELYLSADGVVCASETIPWKALAPIDVVGSHTSADPTYGFGMQAVQVRVDSDTGAVVPMRVAIGYDCGRVVDRQSVTAQLIGAAAQAIGQAQFEAVVYDASGQPRTTTLLDYPLPLANTTPPVSVRLWEYPTPLNPLGVKGVGEAGAYGAAPALANAVAQALDCHEAAREIPIRPATVVAAVHGRYDAEP